MYAQTVPEQAKSAAQHAKAMVVLPAILAVLEVGSHVAYAREAATVSFVVARDGTGLK